MTDAALVEDAIAIFEAGVRAVDPERLVRAALEGGRVDVAEGRTALVAIGKAAAPMLRGLAGHVAPSALDGALVVVPGTGSGPPATESGSGRRGRRRVRGGHPLPDEGSRRAGGVLRDVASELGADDLLVLLLSGGGSALVCLPPEGVALEEVRTVTASLLASGATIDEMNSVRKHLDELKGGGLARLASPARVEALVLSDVPGDRLDVIASGPVSPDPTTFADAIDVLRRRSLWSDLPHGVRRHLRAGLDGKVAETPGEGDPCFERVSARIVGSGSTAARAAAREAERRGYDVRLGRESIRGEARDVGRTLAREALAAVERPTAWIHAGETTVTVRGGGTGGRNQEVALAAALALEGTRGRVVLSAGTDGVDGPTDAAGAVADGGAVGRGRAGGVEAERALRDNDSHHFFDVAGGLVRTGPTGTNVADLMVGLAVDR